MLDALAFSSVLVAASAAALCAASGLALGARVPMAAPALAFCGSLVVYNVDRLRDLERDQLTSPRRASFVVRHRRGLTGLVLVAALGCLPLGPALGPEAALALLPALGLGLMHRRLKALPVLKPLYITGAWLLVVVLLPGLATGTLRGAQWAAGILGSALLANAIASNVRDGEAGAARFGATPVLNAARAIALVGMAGVALAPPGARGLWPIPLATLAVLLPFRSSERYGLWIVDGALLMGAGIALGLAP